MEKEIEVYLYAGMERTQISTLFVEFMNKNWYRAGNIQTKEYEGLSCVFCPYCTVFISENHIDELNEMSEIFDLDFNFYIYITLFDNFSNLLYEQLEKELHKAPIVNAFIQRDGDYTVYRNVLLRD